MSSVRGFSLDVMSLGHYKAAVVQGTFWLEGGRLSLDFIATNGARAGELLGASSDLSAWLVATGLTVAAPAVSASQFDEALGLRAALWRLIRASMGEGSVQQADVDLTNVLAARESPRRLLCLRGRELVGQALTPNADQWLGVIARDAIDLLGGPERSLLRRCAAADCSGIYVDRSRGARRKWCSTAGCGNRTRVSAHRERHKISPPSTRQQP
jgi:predicted RNA-binding Zn ribbon-like protein